MSARYPDRSARQGMALCSLLVSSLVLGVPASAVAATPIPSAGQSPRNILLITVDTTRADYLSCYGSALLTTPNIDALASRGVRFDAATAVVPLTGPGHASMLTGLYPRDHGAIRNGVPVAEDIPTLATILSARGYTTAAFISGWTLRTQVIGLHRGFDHFDDSMTDRYHAVNDQRLGDQTADEAVAWLEEEREGPFFLWVHFFDPHEPFTDHKMELAPNPAARVAAPDKDVLRRYSQEVAFADLQVGRVLAALEKSGAVDDTMILLTSDHGEAFGEHGTKGHGRELYQTTQNVPLILVHPLVGQDKVSDLPVSTLDVTPTLLDLLDFPPVMESDGVALAQALVAPGSFAGRAIYQETFPGARKKFWGLFGPKLTGDPTMVAVRRGGWKAIYNPKKDILELFDLSVDPAETTDLSSELTVRAGRFKPLLASHAQRAWRPAGTETALSDEDRKRLESLGYID
jgi:arylsulfatase A-like enzyme